MKVKILGTEYEIIKNANTEEYPKLKNCDGYTDFSIKRIVVADFEKDDTSVDDLEWYKMKVLRHELVHAYIHESGLAENCDWARNEELTDWIAIQFTKMLNTFIEVGALEMIIPIEPPILNPPRVKLAKAGIKSNAEIINEIGKAINKIPIEVNINNLAKGGVIGGDG